MVTTVVILSPYAAGKVLGCFSSLSPFCRAVYLGTRVFVTSGWYR